MVTGCVIRSKPIGILNMEDEAGLDAKLLAVPVAKLLPSSDGVNEVSDMPELVINQIEHFFRHYKDLEKNKWVKIIGWGDSAEAKEEIQKSIIAAR